MFFNKPLRPSLHSCINTEIQLLTSGLENYKFSSNRPFAGLLDTWNTNRIHFCLVVTRQKVKKFKLYVYQGKTSYSYPIVENTGDKRPSEALLMGLSCCVSSPCVTVSGLTFPSLFCSFSLSRQIHPVIKVRSVCSSITAAYLLWVMPFFSSLRLVLSSVSDYFAAMFTSDVREAKQEEVKMEGVDPEALWVLVQYAYTGA